MWDVFISHASEDKTSVVLPLALELEKYCLRVWVDKWVLSPGDSLRQKIDEGISESSLGVIVLSKTFFAKEWPQAELDALFSLAVHGGHAIIPIWHDLSSSEVTKYSPLIASRLALSTKDGIESLAANIAQKLGCKGKPLNVQIDARTYEIHGQVENLALSIRESEDVPGSYSKRRITAQFVNGSSKFHKEIEKGIQLLIILEPLTFYCRNNYSLANCIANYVRLYNEENWRVEGTRLDLWRKVDPVWTTGIYVSSDEANRISEIIGVTDLTALIGGFPNNMLDLGMSVLCNKGVPKLLFELFTREQRDSADYFLQADKLLALSNWTFGPG